MSDRYLDTLHYYVTDKYGQQRDVVVAHIYPRHLKVQTQNDYEANYLQQKRKKNE